MKALKFAFFAILLMLAGYGGWQLWPKSEPLVDVYLSSDFSQAPDGVVGFPSWNAATGKDLLAGPEHAPKINGGGLLVMPSGASAEAPVPAVVILHGSGGDWTGRSVYLANRLARNGIAGFAVNTFVARDLKSTDGYLTRLQKASIYSQIIDGFNALQALQEHPYIVKDKIAVTGFSLGAAAALYSMFEPVAEAALGENGPRFSSHASFYAGCSFDFEDFRPTGAPALIMMGEKDESMSVDRCQWLTEKLRSHAISTELKIYPGAAHGWEQPYPMKFYPEATVTRDCIMLWTASGENVETTTGHSIDTTIGAMRAFSSCSGKGYTQGRHEATMQASWQDFYQFLLNSWNQ